MSHLQATLCTKSLDLQIPHYNHGYNHLAATRLRRRPVYDTEINRQAGGNVRREEARQGEEGRRRRSKERKEG